MSQYKTKLRKLLSRNAKDTWRGILLDVKLRPFLEDFLDSAPAKWGKKAFPEDFWRSVIPLVECYEGRNRDDIIEIFKMILKFPDNLQALNVNDLLWATVHRLIGNQTVELSAIENQENVRKRLEEQEAERQENEKLEKEKKRQQEAEAQGQENEKQGEEVLRDRDDSSGSDSDTDDDSSGSSSSSDSEDDEMNTRPFREIGEDENRMEIVSHNEDLREIKEEAQRQENQKQEKEKKRILQEEEEWDLKLEKERMRLEKERMKLEKEKIRKENDNERKRAEDEKKTKKRRRKGKEES